MPEIEVQSDHGRGRRVAMTGPRIVIGRGRESDVFLPDYRLSRRHAEIEQRGDSYFLIDLGSTNGTFLNGQRVIGERRLRDGDLIALGESRLIFSSGVPEDVGEAVTLVGAQSFPIQHLQARITARSIEVVDLGRHRSQVQTQTRVFQLLSKASASLLGNRSLPELFERILDVIFEAIPVQRCAIVLHDQRHDEAVVRAARSRAGDPIARVSQAISRRVMEQRVAMLIPNVFEDAGLRGRQSILATGVRSALCAPLWLSPRVGTAEEVIGLVYADTQEAAQKFTEDELEILTAFANIAASKIESARLIEENVEKERLENEMRTAADIQLSILPKDAPHVPGCELTGESRSCDAVGGDYHDFHWDGRQLSLTVADVSGKGLGAAMLMTALRAAVHAHWRDPALGAAFTRINRTFFENVPVDRYATCFLARFDPETGKLVYVNAGHPPPLLVRARGQTVLLDDGGPGLGLFDAAEFTVGEVTMAPGDSLLVYSDGVSESWPTSDEAEEHLEEMARSYAAVPVGALRNEVLAAVERRHGGIRTDDCTLVILRWSPPARPRLVPDP
jgi:serine phosphatase RsbU (regulator of sigma subunit)/pSer/pThr/pTyr-binding forkhead associated (FHA) protein